MMQVSMDAADVLVQTCDVARMHDADVSAGHRMCVAEPCGDAATKVAEAGSAEMPKAPADATDMTDSTAAKMPQASAEATDVTDPTAAKMPQASADATDVTDPTAAKMPQSSADATDPAATDVTHAASAEAAVTTSASSAAARQCGRRCSSHSKGDHSDRREHNFAHFESPVLHCMWIGGIRMESNQPTVRMASNRSTTHRT